MTREEIEARVTRLLLDANGLLPDAQLADMQDLARHGEPGVAMENFWTQIHEYDVQLPPLMLVEVRKIAASMELEVPDWFERQQARCVGPG